MATRTARTGPCRREAIAPAPRGTAKRPYSSSRLPQFLGRTSVCLGNIAQIDTPYPTEGFSGLTYVVDRFKGWAHGGHMALTRGERSRLADHAAEVLYEEGVRLGPGKRR